MGMRRPASLATSVPSQDVPGEPGGRALRALVQTFIRTIGLLSGDHTPCGKPLAVSHAHALMVLLERARLGASPGQRELGAVLGIDKSNVARLCQKMERAGHLRQARSPEDGRARLLALTPQGRRVAEAVERSSLARFGELASALPAERRPAVLAALSTLNQAIAATSTPRPSRAAGHAPVRSVRKASGGST